MINKTHEQLATDLVIARRKLTSERRAHAKTRAELHLALEKINSARVRLSCSDYTCETCYAASWALR